MRVQGPWRISVVMAAFLVLPGPRVKRSTAWPGPAEQEPFALPLRALAEVGRGPCVVRRQRQGADPRAVVVEQLAKRVVVEHAQEFGEVDVGDGPVGGDEEHVLVVVRATGVAEVR